MTRKLMAILIGGAAALGLMLLGQHWRAERSPDAWTGGNLLPNADWASADGNGKPDGWTVSSTVARTDASRDYVLEGQYALRIYGSNSMARSPAVKASPGQRFRLGFQALVDPGQQTGDAPARLQVWVHWIDAANDDIQIDKQSPAVIGYAANGEPTWTPVLVETAAAPAAADKLAISIHPLADDVIIVDDLRLNAAGFYVAPWPGGAAAAVSFSTDWETAMGGFIHTRSSGENGLERAVATGLQSRAGTANLLGMLEERGLRGTWFGNGYNFLTGNPEGRAWMGDPTFAWATPANRWQRDWSKEPWFVDDPRGTAQSQPAWYFGDLIAPLKDGGQAIESHTFSHLYAGLSALREWRADLAAWREVAAEQAVAPASALAFPWGSSNGMTEGHWQALAEAGVDTVTRTYLPNELTSRAAPYLLVDRTRFQPRMLPGRDVLALPDSYLVPASQPLVLAQLRAAVASGGALDIWAHTYEIVSPAAIAAWRAAIAAAADNPAVWVATVPEIAAYWRGIRQVAVSAARDGDAWRLRIANRGQRDLGRVTLVLPGLADRVEGATATTTIYHDRLVIDLRAGAVEELTLWLKP